MANQGFNGSTIVFASVTIGNLRGITYSHKAPKINVTDASDTSGTQVIGIPMKSVTVDVVGGTLPTATVGALTIAWFDGTSLGTLTTVAVGDMDVKGSMDGEISGTIEFVNTVT